jgi:hypothetical protein
MLDDNTIAINKSSLKKELIMNRCLQSPKQSLA